MAVTPDPSIPLARLFAMAFRFLIDELHGRLDERGWHDIRPAYGFVLLAVREAPTTSGAIANLLGMTKQAASKLVDSMEEAGFLRRQAAEHDARAKTVALTPQGHRFLADAEEIYAELEADWSDILGQDRVEALRADLHTVLLATHDNTLPPIRPTW